jgi:hypothetical protein
MAKKHVAPSQSHKHRPTPSRDRRADGYPASAPHGLIPGRPGQEVNSGGDTILPPLRPDPPRPVDRQVKP